MTGQTTPKAPVDIETQARELLATISSHNFAIRLRNGDDSILGLEHISSRDVYGALVTALSRPAADMGERAAEARDGGMAWWGGEEAFNKRFEADGEERASSPTQHAYVPHPKYPWFCDECGYPERERLKHLNASDLEHCGWVDGGKRG